MMFIDNARIHGHIGFQLTRRNLEWAPPGRIRVARYTNSFAPKDGRGYYSETYLRQFIRLWKLCILKKKRRIDKYNTVVCLYNTCLNEDTLRYIADYS